MTTMRIYNVLGCVDDGAAFCLAHCPNDGGGYCEEAHGAIFVDSEWQCPPPACDECGESIEGVTVIHGLQLDECEYCGTVLDG
jgi:hypothetical protein